MSELHEDRPGKLVRLRRDDACAECGTACPRGSEAWWLAHERAVRCRVCVEGQSLAAELAGTPGGSALAEGRRRHERRKAVLRARFGRVAPVVELLTEDPRSTRSWLEGGASEARVGAFLERNLAGIAHVLHDRRVPRSRANIDHLVVAGSGVWVVDSKALSGRVSRRSVGPLWRPESRLVVAGRDRTELVNAMRRQVEVVSNALGPPASNVPVRGALCFNGADWGFFPRAFAIGDVLVTWPGDLVARIRAAAVGGPHAAASIAARLAVALPPAS